METRFLHSIFGGKFGQKLSARGKNELRGKMAQNLSDISRNCRGIPSSLRFHHDQNVINSINFVRDAARLQTADDNATIKSNIPTN